MEGFEFGNFERNEGKFDGGENPNAVEEEDDRHGVVLVFRLFACDLKKQRF